MFPKDTPLGAYTRKYTDPAKPGDCDASVDGQYGHIVVLPGATKSGFLEALGRSTTSEMVRRQTASTATLREAVGTERLAHRAASLGQALGVWALPMPPTVFESGRVVYVLQHTDFVSEPWAWRNGLAPFPHGIQAAFDRAKETEEKLPGLLFERFVRDTRVYYIAAEQEGSYFEEFLFPEIEVAWEKATPLQRTLSAVEAEHLSRFSPRWHSMDIPDFPINVLFEHPEFSDYGNQGVLGRAQIEVMAKMGRKSGEEGLRYRETGVASEMVQGWLDAEVAEKTEKDTERAEMEIKKAQSALGAAGY